VRFLSWGLRIALLVLSLALAFILRDSIHDLVIIPLSYLAWQLALVYWAIPQLLMWSLLVLFVGTALAWQLIPDLKSSSRKPGRRSSAEGQVESLAIWISRARNSNYFRWQLANRLGRTARRLNEPTWTSAQSDAPASIHEYLAAGLAHSFVDFPGPRHRFQRREPTPLDLDPAIVVDYLETQMESHRGIHAQGL
jgi:hypothetical protein